MDVSQSLGDDLLDVPNGDPATYCRLCLSDIDVEELFPDGQGPRQELIERIHECTGILITLDEDYPSSVCWMCSLSLEEFQCFRERCHRYDILIRRKRKELCLGGTIAAVNHGYEVVMEDDDDDPDQDDPEGPLLRISSIQERFDAIEDDLSNESLLEPSSYQPVERDMKPDQETLTAYAEHFKAAGNASAGRDTNHDDPERPFKCTLCTRTFKNRANLWEHNRLHTGLMPFSCNDCGTTFSRYKSLMAHKEKYHSKNSTEDPPLRLKCNFCPRVFPRKGDRTQHMKMGHPDQYDPSEKAAGDTPTPSLPQERSTPSARRVSAATSESISVKKANPSPVTNSVVARFCCNMCLSSFETAELLEEHVGLMHPKDGILTCPYCPKTFKARPTLRMHILNHQGKLPYKCDDCGSRFDRRFYLVKHRERYHTGENRKVIHCRFRCKFCPRLFQRKIDRKTHTRMVHSKEIRVKKEKVDQILNDTRTKEDDDDDEEEEQVVVVKREKSPVPKMRKSLPANPSNECVHCGEHFPTAAMLREHIDDQHLKKGKDVKPVLSKVAKKTNSAKTTLSAKRPYKCPYCPKTFTQNYVMKEHTFIHTGSLRYRCDECLAMFNRPHYLRQHKLKYHSLNSNFRALKCRFCSRSFVRKQDIKIHERIAHDVIDESEPAEREILDDSFNGSADNTLDYEGGSKDGGKRDRITGYRKKTEVGRKDPVEDDDIEEIDDENDEDYVVDDDEYDEEEGDDGASEIDGDDDDEDNGGITDNGTEDNRISNSAEDPEIRDVVVTLERIPQDVLQSLDNSNEDDCAESNAESNDNDGEDDDQSTSDRSAGKPRLNVGITLHRCPKCFKVFKTRKSLNHHMIYHQSQLPFSCDECGVQFARNRPLQVHKKRYHSEDAPYVGQRFSCDYCPRIFLRDRDKIFHQRTVHIMERNVLRDEGTPELKKAKIKRRMDFVCIVCCQRFLTEKTCQRHINDFHPAEALPKSSTPVSTELATPKMDPDMEQLEDPKQTISPLPASTPPQPPPLSLFNAGVKPYRLCRCTTCVAIFKDQDNWTAHIRTHSNVRPHHCEPCLLKRKSRTNRKITSVGFKCQYCPKVFNKASSLRVHQRLHTSELRFPCDECGMMYDRYRLLQAHKERYHSEDAMQTPLETFRCVYCPRTFMRQRDCNYHQESVHAM
ncbi:uncharacterized protein LOC129763766 [Toxorhynchites rutilus septentrionalis]|uniref:uncharacterized protein LOC129763766 n=1 Tax=Toxorhynchites rutilus septentrionalis TaxID=329112 RepID=UPI002479D2C2|nr:uncharacterized protein LOC129763766 [Toxorhynchites rutilus septentrionalis]